MTSTSFKELQNNYAHIHSQVVAWGDMDAYQHLNNVLYYRYAESARIGYLEKIDIFSGDINVVIYKNNCTYVRPVYFPDTLYIGVKIVTLRNSSFKMVYDFYSEQQQTIVAKGEAVIVAVDKETATKCLLPEVYRESILKFEKTIGNTVEVL